VRVAREITISYPDMVTVGQATRHVKYTRIRGRLRGTMRAFPRVPLAIAALLLLFSTAQCGRETIELLPDDEGDAGQPTSDAGNSGSGFGGFGARPGSGGGPGFGGSPSGCIPPKCDGECRRCDDNHDCASGKCECGACVECLEKNHCGDGRVCDPRTYRCVPFCDGDGDCGGFSTRKLCREDRNYCVECDGEPGSRCSMHDAEDGWCGQSGECVECTNALQHCPLNRPRCIQGRCKCERNSDCVGELLTCNDDDECVPF
jgi:hypothetical protein